MEAPIGIVVGSHLVLVENINLFAGGRTFSETARHSLSFGQLRHAIVASSEVS
jgi:hypothetical protein